MGESRESKNPRSISDAIRRGAAQPLTFFLPSTRSTLYFLLSWLFGGSAYASQDEPVKNTMTFAFEKLLVYQKSVDFAEAVCLATERFERGYGFLVDQLNRAALSISSNIAEGNGRFTKADRKHFFGIARGSVQECVPQLELARRRGLIDDAKHAELKSQLEEISRMLSGLIKGLENRET